jgi:hypothetical protein
LIYLGPEVLALNSRTPFSGRPHLIASRTYDVRGILIDRGEIVAEMYFLEEFPESARRAA